MTIDEAKEAEIRRLHFAEHWKVGTIVAQLGEHHEVVERVLGLGKGARSSPVVPDAVAAVKVPAPLLTYEAFVSETLTQYPRLRATRLYDMLVGRGYEGSVRSLRRHVQLVRPSPKARCTSGSSGSSGSRRRSTGLHVQAAPRRERARSGSSSWSWPTRGRCGRSLCFDLTVESLRRSLVRAGRFFRGVARQWLFDNPKTVVLERHGDAVRFHPGLLALSGLLCVAPRLCGVRKPQQKGGVERAIRFLRERFFAARTIRDPRARQRQLLDFSDEIANLRPHPRWPDRTRHRGLRRGEGAAARLAQPLPETDVVQPVPVDKTAFVQFDTNQYSVPSYPRRRRRSRSWRATRGAAARRHGGGRAARAVLGKTPAHRSPPASRELLEQKRAARMPRGATGSTPRSPASNAPQALGRSRPQRRLDGRKAAQLLDLYGVDMLARPSPRPSLAASTTPAPSPCSASSGGVPRGRRAHRHRARRARPRLRRHSPRPGTYDAHRRHR